MEYKYNELDVETEVHKKYLLEIHIEGEPEWRYVTQSYPEYFTDKQMGNYISAFLRRNKYNPVDTNYSIRVITYIQTIGTVAIVENIDVNPYVEEK